MVRSKGWLLMGALLTGVVALLQWSVIVGRFYEGMWGWYKFRNFGGGGELTLSPVAQVQFFLASFAALVAAYRVTGRTRAVHPFTWKLARAMMWLLGLGMLVWAAVLASPLVVWR